MEVVEYKGDVQELKTLADLWKARANSSEFNMDLDWSHVRIRLRQMVDNEYMDLLTLQSDKGNVLGFMGIVMLPSPLDGKPWAREHFFYVRPEHRGPGGIKLIHAAEAWAKKYECSALLLTASRLASAKHDRVEKLYERMDYKPFETTYIKEFA